MESNPLYNRESQSKERGDSLEMAVEHIFKAANFNTERNVFIAKYQIDVKAVIGDRTLIIECKNYQNSNLTIRNIIHQWNSKNQLIKAHKVIIVLTGLTIKGTDSELASELGIELWGQDDITDLFNLSLKPDELRARLLEKISFSPLTIAERYRDDITYLVIKPLLSNNIIDLEKRYWYFNKWLRAHILTELQMVSTSKDEREKHIELFEGSKRKKGFLNIPKKRKEVEYWNTVLQQLTTNEILSEETQNTYLRYMNDLLNEFNAQEQFFASDDYLAKTERLIASRLKNAILSGQSCLFKVGNSTHNVNVVYLDDGNFAIRVILIDEKTANIINWIMTAEFRVGYNETTKSDYYFWICGSFQETVDKIYRLFTEFHSISSKDILKDLNLQ